MPTGLADEIDVLAKAKRIIGDSYVPSDADPYMSEAQLDYFRRLLGEWKKSILDAAAGTLQQLQDGPMREPDLNDRASSETDWGIELRTRDRQRKLIAKIDSALRRIEEGEYGYCEVTGEPIGLGPADRPSDRHDDRGSPGSTRAPREDFPRRLGCCAGGGTWCGLAAAPGEAATLAHGSPVRAILNTAWRTLSNFLPVHFIICGCRRP